MRSAPISLQMGFASDDFSYLIDLGLPTRNESSAFNLDPEIKREVVWSGPVMRPASMLVKRKRTLVELRGKLRRRFVGELRRRAPTVRERAH